MPDRGRTLSPEIALDHYWDAILAGSSAAPEDRLDPGLAATALHVHALDATPAPHPAFASSLWEDLMSARTLSPTIAVSPSSPLHVRPVHVPGRRFAPMLPQPVSRIAAAILLVALLAGSAFAALYPLRMWDTARLPLFAPAATPTAEPEFAGERVLLDLTLADFPPYLTEGGMTITRYPPGGSSRELTPEATEVFYIAGGPMMITVAEAPEPVRVIPAHEPGTAAPASELDAGEEATLETGTTLVAPPGTVIDLVNAGTAATTMLDLLWASTSFSTEEGGATWERAHGWMSQDLVLPVSFLLRQVTLDAGEALPPSVSRDLAQSVSAIDPVRAADVVGFTDGSAHNASDEPLEAYVLTVTNNAETAASPASTIAPDAANTREFLWESAGGPDPIFEPNGVSIDPQGNVWVSDGKARPLPDFHPGGRLSRDLGHAWSRGRRVRVPLQQRVLFLQLWRRGL